MKTYTVSVVIPAYNEAQTISSCLDSLLKQTRKPEEIVIVDDGSTDKTREIISQFPVKLYKSNHGGPGKARNLGVSKSTGDVLVFVDADMTFDKDFIRDLTNPIFKGTAKGVFNTKEYVANFDKPLARCWNINNGLKGKERMDPDSLEDTEDFRAILKSEFLRVGGFDLNGYTDSRTLVKKLGYRPQKETMAISYHANPESYKEVFLQSKWIGKRKTKFGLIGKLGNLLRHCIPVSIFIGIYKSIKFSYPQFILFKIDYDFGYSLGILSSIFSTDLNK